jgi:hypothetical protein
MKKQLIIFEIIVILITAGLSGCAENPSEDVKNKFIGVWKNQDTSQNLTFFSDGTIPNFIINITGNWVISNGKLIISISINQITFDLVYEFSFSNNDKTLTLKLIQPKGMGYDNTAGTYTKQ